jgi:signal transduction histidine kinase
MSRSEKTASELDSIADELSDIAKDIRTVSRDMRESGIETLILHVEDLTTRIIPAVRMWSVRTRFQLEKVKTAQGTKLQIDPSEKTTKKKRKPE